MSPSISTLKDQADSIYHAIQNMSQTLTTDLDYATMQRKISDMDSLIARHSTLKGMIAGYTAQHPGEAWAKFVSVNAEKQAYLLTNKQAKSELWRY